MGFKKILCAVDFSPPSLAGFEQATELALHGPAKLFVLHVLEAQPVISQWLTPDRLGDVTLELETAAKKSMDQLLDSVDPRKLSVQTEITTGRAFVEILRHTQEWKADLVVIGAKGTASLDQLVMGSTADRVMKDSNCSVLVVRDP